MASREIKDPDRVEVAIAKAREHAKKLGKPLQLDRVALFLGVNHQAVEEMMEYDGEDEAQATIAYALKMAKQESRADIQDCLSDKGNVTGYIFQGKANHGMVETTTHEINIKPVTFIGADEIPD